MRTPLFGIPLCLAVAAVASEEKLLDERAVFGFPASSAAQSSADVTAATGSDYYSSSTALPTTVTSTTDSDGQLSTFSIVNGSTINVITTATGSPPITITSVPSGQAGIVTVINGETYTIATATGIAGQTGLPGSASTLTPSWSVPLLSSAVIGLLGAVAGAYIVL